MLKKEKTWLKLHRKQENFGISTNEKRDF